MEQDLDILLRQISEKDKQALQQLYNIMRQKIFLLAYSILGNPQDAEDILQNTIIAIWSNPQSYKTNGGAEAWVLKIARNQAIDVYRKNKRRHYENIENYAHSLASPEEADYSFFIENELQVLNFKQRQIVLLHCAFSYRHNEIAAILHLSYPAVRKQYAAAMKKLRQLLLQKGDVIGNAGKKLEKPI